MFALSSGGVLALEAAAHGLAITKLALYEPPDVVDDNDRRASEDITAQLTELRSLGRRGDAVELWMTKAVGVQASFIVPMRNEPFCSAFSASGEPDPALDERRVVAPEERLHSRRATDVNRLRLTLVAPILKNECSSPNR